MLFGLAKSVHEMEQERTYEYVLHDTCINGTLPYDDETMGRKCMEQNILNEIVLHVDIAWMMT